MPHISPMSWALAPLIFWFSIFFMTSVMWWSQPIQFPPISTSSPSSHLTKWNWSCFKHPYT